MGNGNSGREDLAQLVARLNLPSGGRLDVAGVNFADVHQAVPGRRIAYASQNAHIFTGTLSHNLYYGLKHRPVHAPAYDAAAEKVSQRRVQDAVASGNSPHDVRANWIDYELAGVADAEELAAAAVGMLKLVEMEREGLI